MTVGPCLWNFQVRTNGSEGRNSCFNTQSTRMRTGLQITLVR